MPHDAMFYVGCVTDAFEHLHSLGVAYRDLKVRPQQTAGLLFRCADCGSTAHALRRT